MEDRTPGEVLKNTRVLVDTLELNVTLEDDELTLRVEIFETISKPRHYSVRIWRLEHYRLQATFPQLDGSPVHAQSDEIILKEFEGIELPIEPRYYADPLTARAAFLAELEAWVHSQVTNAP
ncbi:MAG TPA: hypothetical protein VK550_22635 [Polyangiaceae bacterium]|nr:hypothetical protein [Polyangiaceae bacterium]